MKKLKCNQCLEEWYVEEERIKKLQVCPFCRNVLQHQVSFDENDSLGKAIYSAIVCRGIEIVNSVRMLSSYLYDSSPWLKKEIRIMTRALSGRDSILQMVFSSECSESSMVIARLKQSLVDEDGIAESWADEICTALNDAVHFGMDKNEIRYSNASVEDVFFYAEQSVAKNALEETAPVAPGSTPSPQIDILKYYICKDCSHHADGFDMVFGGQSQCPICGGSNWTEDVDEIRTAANNDEEILSSTSAFSDELKRAKSFLFEFKNDEALTCYRDLAKAGCVAAYVPTAQIYYKSGQYKQAWKWFLEAANAGVRDGLFSVGHFYQAGIYVTKNDRLAFKYYRMASEKGHIGAMYELSQCYLSGKGCEKDESMAKKYLSILAEHGNADAQMFMGESYRRAGGVKNMIKAAEYYRRAGKSGNADGTKMYEECICHLPPQAKAFFSSL